MAKAVLPFESNVTGAAEWHQVYESDVVLREAVNDIPNEQIVNGTIKPTNSPLARARYVVHAQGDCCRR
jgi:hypothetical protein